MASAMASATALPFFAREKDGIKVFTFDHDVGALVEKTGEPFPLPTPKAAQWSPDGLALALIDPATGVQVLTVSEDTKDMAVSNLEACPKTTQAFLWSPRSSCLVTIAPGSKGSTEPNVHVWRNQGAGFDCHASFCYPKLERDKKVLQWTSDEFLCARLLPDGKIHILNGQDLVGAPLAELALAHAVQTFEFAPLRPRGNVRARLAVFTPDSRDDLQRVVGPAEVTIFDIAAQGHDSQLLAQEKAKSEVASGQVAELLWNSTGTALVGHCQTEVDESGKSYYGGSKLAFLSHDGEYKKDLTEAEAASPTGTSVQAVAWSPTRDEFILIQGFQPAQAALWSWDERAKKVSVAKVLLEKAHRNTIRFNQFGSLVCLAGFGNLAGEVDFFGRPDSEKCDFVRISSCTANCTVSAEWAPDGRHFLTSVLAPRMRVDNGAYIWRALTGTKVSGMDFEELYDTQWRPEPPNSLRFLDVSFEEVANASKELANKGAADGGAPKRQAYRPPKARGEGASTVAAMMRGEVAAPDQDDRRARKARQPRQRDEDHEPTWGEEHRERKDNAEPEPEQPVQQPQQQSPQQSPQQPPQQQPQQQQQPQPQAREAPRQPPPPPPPEAPPRQPSHAEAAAAARREAQNAAAMAAAQAEAEAYHMQVARQQAAQQELLHKGMELAQVAAGGAGYPANARQAAQQQAAAAAYGAPQRQAQAQAQQAAAQQARAAQVQQQQQQQLQQQQAAAARQMQQQAAQQQAAAAQRPAAQQQQQQARQPARQQQPQPPQPTQMQNHQGQGHGTKLPCPATGWQYVDPKQNIQGPFSLMEMQQWNSMGYFRPELPMRCDSKDQFVPFGELFPHPLIPFQSYPKRPTRLSGIR